MLMFFTFVYFCEDPYIQWNDLVKRPCKNREPLLSNVCACLWHVSTSVVTTMPIHKRYIYIFVTFCTFFSSKNWWCCNSRWVSVLSAKLLQQNNLFVKFSFTKFIVVQLLPLLRKCGLEYFTKETVSILSCVPNCCQFEILTKDS